MSKNIDFEVGTIVTDTFLDSLQELLSGTINNFRLSQTATSTAMIGAALTGDSINDKRATINIGGKYVYTDQAKDCELPVPTPPSTAPYDIYLSTVSPATPTLDPPDFKLSIGTPGSLTGPGTQAGTYLRKIGSLDTDGSQVSNVKMSNGVMADADQYNAFTFRSVMDQVAEVETVLTLRGQDSQISAPDALVSDPSLTPTKAVSFGYDTAGTYGENLYVDTAGRLVWSSAVLTLLAANTLGTNAELSVWREGLNTTGAYDDPTQDVVANITRDDGVAAFGGRIDADTVDRFQISQTGVVQWGDGADPLDTGFYRVKPNALAMLPLDKFYLDYTIDKINDTGKLATNKEYVDTEVAYAISQSKRFAFFITP